MNETRYAIRMTTPKGDFWWTGTMIDTDDSGHGAFTSFGWSSAMRPRGGYMNMRLADEKAASLLESLGRMYEIERMDVVQIEWSAVFGWQPVAAESI